MGSVRGATRAQAKINLILHVGGRKPDGYHDIYTLFQRIDLSDDIIVEATATHERILDCGDSALGPATQNTAWIAAQLYAAQCEWPAGFRIQIRKQIPTGGGLGGGSADAAAVLRILNTLAPRPLSRSALLELGTRVGSDVPFLVSDMCLASATGRGERLQAIATLPQRTVSLLFMPFGVATADAYRWLDESRSDPALSGALRNTQGMLPPFEWNQVAASAHNDFEAVVAERHPGVASLLASLRAMPCEMAGMSGSGSTLFLVHLNSDNASLRNLPMGVRAVSTSTVGETAPIVTDF